MQYRMTGTDALGPIYTGRRVLDEHGLTLGTVSDVVFDDGEYEPVYLVVDPGLLRRPHYVPATGACQTPSGHIVVPWDRDWFRISPTAGPGPTLTARRRREVDSHYAPR